MSARRRRSSPRSRRIRGALAALLLLALILALAGYIYERNRTGNIYHPHARFIAQPTPTLAAAGPARFAWPIYGYSQNHTRFFPAPGTVHPPFRRLWVNNSHALLEFPPVIYGDQIFQLGDDGVLSVIDKLTGHTLWKRALGRLSASSPAVNATTVYLTILSTGNSRAPGRVFALNSRTGQTRWARELPSPSESSPMLNGERLYFGSQSGLVYALNARSGTVIWTYHASGSVKASPTLADGVLYFGDYSGHVQAISAATGHRIWRSASEGALLGSGTFYSTAAVVYGRVFLGNTDGRVYAYDASSGKLDWAVQTGDYVYASPAVTNAPGLGPTVYVGSYSGRFYAINARTGHFDWHLTTHGRISGSATIIGRIVYFADLGEHRTRGVGISTGRVLFEDDTGAFDPVISDSEHIYLTGTTGLYALAPTDLAPAAAAHHAHHHTHSAHHAGRAHHGARRSNSGHD